MEQKKIVYEVLDRLNIKYRIVEHPAVYTIEDMDKLTDLTNQDASFYPFKTYTA